MNFSEAASPLWDVACELWKDSGIRDRCLTLQDAHGLNPNELLFAIWCGRKQRLVDHQRLASSAARAWHGEVTGPVRTARRNAGRRDAVPGQVMDQLRSAELGVEQVELRLLYDDAERICRDADLAVDASTRRNLQGFYRNTHSIGSESGSQCQNLLEELAACCVELSQQ